MAGSTAAPRACRSRSARSAFAACASSTSPTCKAEAGRRRPDLPRIAHPYAGDRPNDKTNIYVYGSGTARCVRRRADRLLVGARAEGRSEDRAVQHRRDPGAAGLAGAGAHREPAAHLCGPCHRRISGLWPGGKLTARARRRSRSPTAATTSPSSRRSDWRRARAPGTASSWTSPTRATQTASMRSPTRTIRLLAFGDVHNDGSKVLFTDEWGGGTRPRCRATDPPNWGADAIFDIVDRSKLNFASYYKMPAAQSEQENCVAHNGSLIPCRDATSWSRRGIRAVSRCSISPTRESPVGDRVSSTAARSSPTCSSPAVVVGLLV